jgi:hypothetical protein
LFGSDVPETDRQSYDAHLTKGETALSVLVDAPSIADVEAVEEVLEQYHPINMHAESSGSTGSGVAAGDTDQEQVIPLPQEELNVGKRATERVKRIRTYVVEEPIEKEVNLRDERTVVEKRPATGTAATGPMERE